MTIVLYLDPIFIKYFPHWNMSKIIYVCYRDRDLPSSVSESIDVISNRLNPDNIQPNPTQKYFQNGIAYGIINPMDSIAKKGGSVVMGKLFGDQENWNLPKQVHPDGSFALFRQDHDYVELVSDVVASRTIWYFQDNKVLI